MILSAWKNWVLGLFVFVILGVILAIAYAGKASTWFAFIRYVPGGDKTGHFVLMFLLSVGLSLAFSCRGVRIGGFTCHFGALLFGVFISLEEVFQLTSVFRNFDWLDMLCNLGGIMTGVVLLNGGLFIRMSRKVFNRQAGSTD